MTIFDHELVVVIYVLGGPGVGKGTQCSLLAKEFDFEHISAGALLRKEQPQESDSDPTKEIRECIKKGAIVDAKIMIPLLENAMKATFKSKQGNSAWKNGKGRFLIDGFPRNMKQAEKFDNAICRPSFVIHLECDEDTMLARTLERGKTSDREDDNIESLKKRFIVHKEETKPVIEYYEKLGKLTSVDGRPNKNEVFQTVRQAINHFLEDQE